MKDGSARSNVISPLRDLGLLDVENKPTDLAARWRHDDEYAAVCHEIRQKTYPHELVEAFSEPDVTQKEQIKTWFMKRGDVGEVAAKMYADTYLLLSQADPTGAEEKTTASSPRRAPGSAPKAESKRPTKPSPVQEPVTAQAAQSASNPETTTHRRLPAIHIDVQVHISPDTSPEQIDRIFESMAKHLGTFTK